MRNYARLTHGAHGGEFPHHPSGVKRTADCSLHLYTARTPHPSSAPQPYGWAAKQAIHRSSAFLQKESRTERWDGAPSAKRAHLKNPLAITKPLRRGSNSNHLGSISNHLDKTSYSSCLGDGIVQQRLCAATSGRAASTRGWHSKHARILGIKTIRTRNHYSAASASKICFGLASSSSCSFGL